MARHEKLGLQIFGLAFNISRYKTKTIFTLLKSFLEFVLLVALTPSCFLTLIIDYYLIGYIISFFSIHVLVLIS